MNIRLSSRMAAIISGIFVACACLSTVYAKPKKSPPSQTEDPSIPDKASGSAWLRLWFTSDSVASNNIHVQWRTGAKTEKAVELSQGTGQFQFSDYQEIPDGPGIIATLVAGKDPVLLPANFFKDMHATVLVRVQEGQAYTDLIRDDASAPSDVKGFSVYNFFLGGRSIVEVSFGDVLKSTPLLPGGSLRLRGVKPALYTIMLNGTDGEGKPFRWSGETDLHNLRRATLLICPDSYGRIRPRVIEDASATPAK